MNKRIVGASVTLRRAQVSELGVLGAIVKEPAVARWWQQAADTELAALVTTSLGDTTVFVIEHDDHVVGCLSMSEETDPNYRHASIDISLTTLAQGQGLGTDAVRMAARWLVNVGGHHRVTIDPAHDNAVAIACYRKVGFRPVGVLRQYERRDDGRWHDGLLMDLLANELR